MEALDGNAIASLLLDVFGTEMTTASGVCASCGARAQLAELVVYVRAPGTVVRCRSCASVLMVLLRIVQGLCLGGELPGALTYVVETAPSAAPFVCGLVFSCVTLGVAAATGVSVAGNS